MLRNKPNPQASSADPNLAGAVNIDSDLVNVANENRVILNVGGIRHETYKVSETGDHLLPSSASSSLS